MRRRTRTRSGSNRLTRTIETMKGRNNGFINNMIKGQCFDKELLIILIRDCFILIDIGVGQSALRTMDEER